MTVTQRVNLVRNAEEHIRALTAVIDFLVQSPIFGSDDQLVKFLKDGTIAALVVQDPFRMGYDGVKIALAAFSQRLAMKVIAAEVAAHLGMLARKAATESRARGVGGFFKTVTGRTRTLYEQDTNAWNARRSPKNARRSGRAYGERREYDAIRGGSGVPFLRADKSTRAHNEIGACRRCCRILEP